MSHLCSDDMFDLNLAEKAFLGTCFGIYVSLVALTYPLTAGYKKIIKPCCHKNNKELKFAEQNQSQAEKLGLAHQSFFRCFSSHVEDEKIQTSAQRYV